MSSRKHRGRSYLPYAFTEQGVAMLSSVLRSRRAVHVNIAIMRAFVRLREMLLTNAELARKLADLEQKYDSQFNLKNAVESTQRHSAAKPRCAFAVMPPPLFRIRGHLQFQQLWCITDYGLQGRPVSLRSRAVHILAAP